VNKNNVLTFMEKQGWVQNDSGVWVQKALPIRLVEPETSVS